MLFAGEKTADFWAFVFCIAYNVIIARDNLKNSQSIIVFDFFVFGSIM